MPLPRNETRTWVLVLASLTLLVSAADHWTTFVCLRNPVPGWDVSEANPLAAWLFERLGLVRGLLLDSVITILAITVLVRVAFVPHWAKLAILGIVVLATSLAVTSNLHAVDALGLSLL